MKTPSTRTVNEWMVIAWLITGLFAMKAGHHQEGATFAMVAATWRLGNTWTDR